MHHWHRGYGRGGFPLVGILLVVMGGWWLLGEMGYVTFDWSYIGPIAVLLVGLGMLLGRARWRGHGGEGDVCWCCGRPWKEATTEPSTGAGAEAR